MSEWHITPEYIINNWTDEKLDLMVEKLTERKKLENKPSPSDASEEQVGVSADVLAAQSRGMIQVVRK